MLFRGLFIETSVGNLSPVMGARNQVGIGLSYCVGNFSPAMGAKNQVGIGLSYRPASLCSLATQFQTRFLESIPHPIAALSFRLSPKLYFMFRGSVIWTQESIPPFYCI